MSRKVKLSFPNGTSVRCTLQEETEPELSKSLWDFCEQPQWLICHNTLSTGYAYGAYSRPSSEPIEAGYMGRPLGNHAVSYTQVQPGEIVWTGNRMFVSYGKCTEPGMIGAIVIKVDAEDMDAFVRASYDIWMHTYSYHKLAVITVEREVA